jgi:hypothetical protein
MKVGVLSIQGLPARYGAFEQAVDQLARFVYLKDPSILFMVGCVPELESSPIDHPNVHRIYVKRRAKFGVIVYGLLCFMHMYRAGVRDFLIMGYGLAPFFKLFEFLGCNLTVNVDGFEWRRAKWGRLAKTYFRWCELFSARSNAELIYDSIGVARYYGIVHGRPGHTVFYGEDSADSIDELRLSDLRTRAEQLTGVGEYLVVVMRMEPENHIREIVSGFLASKTARSLILVGPSTPFFESVVRPLIECDNESRVKWLGPIYDRQLLRVIREAAVAYIHGHSVGGTNPTLVEAVSFNKPIIAFGSIFNREVLGFSALYFNDEVRLAALLDENVAAFPLPCRLDESYTWPYVCEKYLSVIRRDYSGYGRGYRR